MANVGAFACVCNKPTCAKCKALDAEWAPDVVAERTAHKPLRLTAEIAAMMRGLNWDASGPGDKLRRTVAC